MDIKRDDFWGISDVVYELLQERVQAKYFVYAEWPW